jgi:hypothetical protein
MTQSARYLRHQDSDDELFEDVPSPRKTRRPASTTITMQRARSGSSPAAAKSRLFARK